jgi:hypothetical protein
MNVVPDHHYIARRRKELVEKRAEIRGNLLLEHHDALKSASFFRRFFLMHEINREAERQLKVLSPALWREVSVRGIYNPVIIHFDRG